ALVVLAPASPVADALEQFGDLAGGVCNDHHAAPRVSNWWICTSRLTLATTLEGRGAGRSGIRLPAPRTWTPFRSENFATLQCQHRHHGLADSQTGAKDIMHCPVAFLDAQ